MSNPINEPMAWVVIMVLIVITVVAIVALRRAMLFAPRVSIPSLAATGIVAFQRTPRRVQRHVNHLPDGDRDAPYRVATRLGEVLSNTVDPLAVPTLLTETIAGSLQVPYVAMETYGPRVIAEHGIPDQAVDAFDMLSLVPVTLLIHDLRESPERLVVAHEEERGRLRRDINDGLGQSIAGMCMQVRAAQRLIAPQTQATTILNELADDLQTCTVEVRRLVDQLRPPALDRGLAGALGSE